MERDYTAFLPTVSTASLAPSGGGGGGQSVLSLFSIPVDPAKEKQAIEGDQGIRGDNRGDNQLPDVQSRKRAIDQVLEQAVLRAQDNALRIRRRVDEEGQAMRATERSLAETNERLLNMQLEAAVSQQEVQRLRTLRESQTNDELLATATNVVRLIDTIWTGQGPLDSDQEAWTQAVLLQWAMRLPDARLCLTVCLAPTLFASPEQISRIIGEPWPVARDQAFGDRLNDYYVEQRRRYYLRCVGQTCRRLLNGLAPSLQARIQIIEQAMGVITSIFPGTGQATATSSTVVLQGEEEEGERDQGNSAALAALGDLARQRDTLIANYNLVLSLTNATTRNDAVLGALVVGTVLPPGRSGTSTQPLNAIAESVRWLMEVVDSLLPPSSRNDSTYGALLVQAMVYMHLNNTIGYQDDVSQPRLTESQVLALPYQVPRLGPSLHEFVFVLAMLSGHIDPDTIVDRLLPAQSSSSTSSSSSTAPQSGSIDVGLLDEMARQSAETINTVGELQETFGALFPSRPLEDAASVIIDELFSATPMPLVEVAVSQPSTSATYRYVQSLINSGDITLPSPLLGDYMSVAPEDTSTL
ncbi:hypothetical protein [Mollivirus kamchatka]|nr:hypothetical protein [Mollivirus kamchatka]